MKRALTMFVASLIALLAAGVSSGRNERSPVVGSTGSASVVSMKEAHRSLGSATASEERSLTFVLERTGQLSIHGIGLSSNQICKIVAARLKRLGAFPVIIYGEVCTRQVVAADAIEMIEGVGVTNIEYVASDQDQAALSASLVRRPALRDSPLVVGIVLGISLAIGVVVMGVTCWCRRNGKASREHCRPSGADGRLLVRPVWLSGAVAVGVTLIAWAPSVWACRQTVEWVDAVTWALVTPAYAVLAIICFPALHWDNPEGQRLVSLGVALLINGLAGLWAGYVASFMKLIPAPVGGGLWVRGARLLVGLVPLVLPLILYFAYRSTNDRHTGNVFGCGCVFRFNANYVNMILSALVLWLCWALLFVGARHLGVRFRMVYLWGGAVVAAVVTWWCCQRLVFL